MSIGLQAYLQGYMHEKTAAVGLDPNKPIPPNIQQHLSPGTGETPQADFAAGTWGGDGTYYSGRPINDPNLEFQRSNQPQGLTKGQQEQRAAALREQKKQWWNPKPAIEGIRNTAVGAASDLYRLGAGIHGPYSQALPDHPSFVGDIKEQAQYLAKDPIGNTKQMLKDMIAGPGGFWNAVAAPLAGGSLASKLRRKKPTPSPLPYRTPYDPKTSTWGDTLERWRRESHPPSRAAERARASDLTDHPYVQDMARERNMTAGGRAGPVRLKKDPPQRPAPVDDGVTDHPYVQDMARERNMTAGGRAGPVKLNRKRPAPLTGKKYPDPEPHPPSDPSPAGTYTSTAADGTVSLKPIPPRPDTPPGYITEFKRRQKESPHGGALLDELYDDPEWTTTPIDRD